MGIGTRLYNAMGLPGLRWAFDLNAARPALWLTRITLFAPDPNGPIITLYSGTTASFNDLVFRARIESPGLVDFPYVEGDTDAHKNIHSLIPLPGENSITAGPHVHIQITQYASQRVWPLTDRAMEEKFREIIVTLSTPPNVLISAQDAVDCINYFAANGWA